MPIVVQKYGGSSVATVQRLKLVAQKIVARKRAGADLTVVVSAMGDATNKLLELAREVTPEPPRRELDMLLTVGERTSMALLSMAIGALGEEAISFTGSQCGILTTASHSRARIMEVRPFRVQDELSRGRIVIVAGFQGTSYTREITTLGRGGSDLTAVALAAALQAEACEIYSDVDGVLSADPRVVPAATRIEELSHAEMEAMARGGAKVLHKEAVAWARRAGVALYARSTFEESSGGTAIRLNPPPRITPVVAVTGRKDNLVVYAGVDRADAVEELLASLPVQQRIRTSDGLSWLLAGEDLHEAGSLCSALQAAGATTQREYGSVSVVGSGLGESPDVYRQIHAHLGRYPGALTEAAWRALVPPENVDRLVRTLHRELLEDTVNRVALVEPVN